MIPEATYHYDDQYRFLIDNYNWARPFSNYFPGIAGKWGIPMWVYYISRGQAICSIGVENKDHAIMEFQSFNKACMSIGSTGFRTFMRIGGGPVYEPFRKLTDPRIQQQMLVSAHELEIREVNHRLGLEFRVTYFPLVNQSKAGLVRTVEIRNLGNEVVELDLIDGLPRLFPYGMTFEHAKVIARHIEGMMVVDEIEGFPLFRLKQTPADVERVGAIQGGNFYVSFSTSHDLAAQKYLVDPFPVFGDLMNFDQAWSFELHGMEHVLGTQQVRENRTPCGMTALSVRVEPTASFNLHSVIGFTPEEQHFPDWVAAITSARALEAIRKQNQELIAAIKTTALTVSNEPLFDQYCEHTFLENVMRGGMPLTLRSEKNTSHFYTYLRQNGDLERDYHWFILEPTYLSQGNSHYRNILQNRRMDTWFFPAVKDQNLIALANLIQLDGYNPLEVNGVSYTVHDKEQAAGLLNKLVSDKQDFEQLCQLIHGQFTPGRFIMGFENCPSRVDANYEAVLADLLALCVKNEIGGRYEGYWIDHWTYLLDMVEVVFSMYPEKVREILLDRRDYSFFDSPDIVQPRAQKIVSTANGLRQYDAVRFDPEKADLIQARREQKTRVRTQNGRGEIYYTNLLGKLLCILANRLASLDVRGIGSEMEASKPGWCDSLNGLPALFASSICEALELIRACRLLLNAFDQCAVSDQEVTPIFEELAGFLQKLDRAICQTQVGTPAKRAQFWAESHDLLEIYREQVRLGVNGQESGVSIGQIRDFLTNAIAMLENNFSFTVHDELFSPEGVPYTYFINWLTKLDDKSATKDCLTIGEQPVAVQHQPVASFLEGPVHFVRVFPDQAASVHRAVRNSPLFDNRLQMYRNCAPLDEETLEIGRIKAYANGWLENQSIYTHMEYKWLLELFRAGLFSECFAEFKNLLIPFLDPKSYGRSTVDNCSFIVSSAFSDPNMHGQAFQPHLSGMTCEFLNIWTLMVAGRDPFSTNENGQIAFKLDPALPGWLFTKEDRRIRYWDERLKWQEVTIPKNSFAFKLFGSILVIYTNERRMETYGPAGVQPCRYSVHFLDGREIIINDRKLSDPIVAAIREDQIVKMEVLLEQHPQCSKPDLVEQ